MNNSFLPTLSATVLLMLCGCSTPFQKHKLDEVSVFAPAKSPQSIYLDLAFSGKLNGDPWTGNDKENGEYLKEQLAEKLKNSGMFSYVSDGLNSTDFQLYVAIINDRQTDRNKQILCALTLFLVPYTEVDEFRMLAILKQISTGKEFRISLEDGVNHRQALLLAPMAPFKSNESALITCTDRLLENLCMEIHKTGQIK